MDKIFCYDEGLVKLISSNTVLKILSTPSTIVEKKVGTSSHYLLDCSNYSEERLAVLYTIKNIDIPILQKGDSKFTSLLLSWRHFF